MQRYAIVIYDKRTGDVFTTLMTAEDGTAAEPDPAAETRQ